MGVQGGRGIRFPNTSSAELCETYEYGRGWYNEGLKPPPPTARGGAQVIQEELLRNAVCAVRKTGACWLREVAERRRAAVSSDTAPY